MNARYNSHPIRKAAGAALTAALLLTAGQPAAVQPGWALSHRQVSDSEGGFIGSLDNWDALGSSVGSRVRRTSLFGLIR